MTQISYSSYDKYMTCPRMWEIHYVEKLRSTFTTSALFFGGTVGRIWQAIALSKKDNLTPEEIEESKLAEDPHASLENMLKTVQINHTEVSPINANVYYYKSDYDEELLTTEDFIKLDELGHKTGQVLPNGRYIAFSDLIARYPFDLDKKEIVYMIWHFYLSLKRKGHMLIDSFQEMVMPNIEKVHSIEKPIKIDMSLEDSPPLTDYLIGYVDMVCDYRITDVKTCANLGIEVGSILTILFDNKTSSSRYGTKALVEKPQLNIYDYTEKIGYIGYIIGIKAIKRPKIGPRKGDTFADIQIMIGKSDEELSNTILDSVDKMLYNIGNGEFPMKKDKNECLRIFGRKCEYYDLCYNNDASKLFKKE